MKIYRLLESTVLKIVHFSTSNYFIIVCQNKTLYKLLTCTKVNVL